MSIPHKFLNQDWNNGFQTNTAVLNTAHYEPEVLIIGTFNPETNPHDNPADFFYGRNYFWPAFHNLINNDPVLLLQRRDAGNHLQGLVDIFSLCKVFRLSFTDLISHVLHNGNPVYGINGNVANYIGNDYNLFNDDDLINLHNHGQVNWNTDAIIEYLRLTPSIRFVYFTRQQKGVFDQKFQIVSQFNYGRPIYFSSIYTPSGQALRGTPRIQRLTHCWLYNPNANYGTLDHDWLATKGVIVGNFYFPL